jgi:hypothetical protein
MKTASIYCVALLVSLLVTPDEAQAADHGWYLGAAYSNLSADYSPPEEFAIPTDFATPSPFPGIVAETIGSDGFKLDAGYRVLDWLAFEADYFDFGSNSAPLGIFCVNQPCPATIRGATASASLSALALWPIGRFDVFARVGLSRWETSLEMFYDDGSRFWHQDIDGTDEKYGAGAQVHFGKIAARLEYEHLRFSADAADTWSLGVAYNFR